MTQLESSKIDKQIFSNVLIQNCKRHLLEGIQQASMDDLAGERCLRRIILLGKIGDMQVRLIRRIRTEDSPKMTFAILRASMSENFSGREEVIKINWEDFKKIYAGDSLVKERIVSLKSEFEDLKPWVEALPMELGKAEKLLEKAIQDLEDGDIF